MTEDGEHPPDARVIGGRYRLTGRLGSGPGGTVWRALDERDHGPVAVKEPLLPGDPATDEESRRIAHRLHHEARAATRVRHPSAVTVYDVVTEDGVPWIVMELVAGESLREVLRRGPVPAAEAARIGLAVLGALRAAHAVGIVHRDVKPANVLLESGTGRVVLTDFGIGDGHAEDAPAGFVAPERAAGPGAGPASDLWSLGALLRTALAGTDPGPPEPLGPLLDRLQAEDPAARPDPHEVSAALGDYLASSEPGAAATGRGDVATGPEDVATGPADAAVPAVADGSGAAAVPVPSDPSPVADASAVSDASPVADASAVSDASPVADASAVSDASPVADASAVSDASPVADASAVSDASPVADASAVSDASPVVDASAVSDASPVVDAPAAADASSASGASAPVPSPRRRTPLSALGLLLARKPGVD
ncbi:protein kinase [Streptomyces sp. NPDC029080]|uniref:protein kinase domain-containing protein n=1 Tax=Streptomyces sp. NPDC029080 TaxID=3155017 RepID=UPI0033DA5C37